VPLKGDVPWVQRFSANAGQLIEIRADRDPSGDAYPHIVILDPVGEEVADEADYNQRGFVRVTYEVQSTGRHTVQVDGQEGSGTVTIRFYVDPYVLMESGNVIPASLDLPDGVDRYEFTGSVGQLIVLRVSRGSNRVGQTPDSPVQPVRRTNCWMRTTGETRAML